MPVLHRSGLAAVPSAQQTEHGDVSVPITDQKVRDSNPFGRTSTAPALTSTNGQG
jgi:hypothetical protein